MNTKKRDELKVLVAELYHELKSGNAVAARLDMAPTTAYRLLREAGIELPDRHSKIVQERKKALQGDDATAAAADYTAGMSLSKLKKKYGVSSYAIHTAVDDAGVHRRKHGGQKRKIDDSESQEMVRLYTEVLLSQAQIAAKFHCSQPVVSRILRNQGIQPKRQRDQVGESHGGWKGGRIKTGGGYIAVMVDQDDPMSIMKQRNVI